MHVTTITRSQDISFKYLYISKTLSDKVKSNADGKKLNKAFSEIKRFIKEQKNNRPLNTDRVTEKPVTRSSSHKYLDTKF